ncbi:MAG: GNAT family N-acetyltransferase [Lawsonella sp.]
MSITFAPAKKSDLEQCAELISRTFGPVEPTLKWYFPTPPSHAQKLAVAHLWMEQAYLDGTLITARSEIPRQDKTDTIIGVAIWQKVDPHTRLSFQTLRNLWQRLKPIMGIHTWRYFHEAWVAHRARGKEAHCYLAALAVSPEARGNGVAKTLINTPPCKKLPIILECREELIPFYARQGFKIKDRYSLPGITQMYAMRKNFN